MPETGEFFRRADVRDALEQLASARTLTVFCGAGISMDAFLPSWGQLIERTAALAEQDGLPRRPGLPEAPDVLSAASQLQARIDLWPECRASLGRYIARSLTEPLPKHKGALSLVPQPGPTILALAEFAVTRLWAAKHIDGWAPATWVTQNFDVLLEAALVQVLRSRDFSEIGVSASVSLDESDLSSVQVRHLHGYVDVPEGTISALAGGVGEHNADDGVGIVLTASHFFTPNRGAERQNAYMGLKLESGPMLFVGSSLTDPHLLGQLYAASSDPHARDATTAELEGRAKHVALMLSRDGGAWPSEDARSDWQRDVEVEYRRWLEVGVKAIPVEFPVQVAQFIHELNVQTAVRVLRERPAEKEEVRPPVLVDLPEPVVSGPMTVEASEMPRASYGRRLNAWFSSACLPGGLVASIAPAQAFRERQEDLACLLDRWLKDCVDALQAAADDEASPDERFTLNLWCRTTRTLPSTEEELRQLLASDQPGITHMALLAAPHRTWRRPSDVLTLPVAFDHSRPAVQAFRRQQPVLDWVKHDGSGAGDPQRLWQTDYSIPLFVPEEYRLGERIVALPQGGTERRSVLVRGRLPLAVLSLNSSYGQDSLVYRALTRTASAEPGSHESALEQLRQQLSKVAEAASSLVYEQWDGAS